MKCLDTIDDIEVFIYFILFGRLISIVFASMLAKGMT